MPLFRDEQRDRNGALTDSELRDPALFIRAQQERQGQRPQTGPDHSFLALGTLLLAGIGGWAAVRHFPEARLSALADEVKSFFENAAEHGVSRNVLPKLHRALDAVSDVVARQPWAHVHQDRLGEFLSSSRVAQDPEVLRGLRIMREAMEKNPKNFVNVMSVQRAAATELLRPIPQDTSGLRSLTLGDLFDPSGGWRRDVFGAMPESFQNVHTELRRMGSIRGMRGSMTDILHKIQVDPGVYTRRSAAGAQDLVNLRGLSPSKWLGYLGEQAKIARSRPFLTQVKTGGIAARMADWMAKLLVPTEVLGGPDVGPVSTEAIRRLLPNASKAEKLRSGFFLGGHVFPVYEGGIGRGIGGNYILGRAASGAGAAARARERGLLEETATARIRQLGLSGHGLTHVPARDLHRILDVHEQIVATRARMGRIGQAQARAAMGRTVETEFGAIPAWSEAATERYGALQARLAGLYKQRAKLGQRWGGVVFRNVGTHTTPTEGPVGRTARYLHEKGIDPSSLKGTLLRFGEKVGIGPQFRLGKTAAEDVLEFGGEIPANLGDRTIVGKVVDLLTGRDTLKHQLNETLRFVRGEESKVKGYYLTTRKQAGFDFFNYLIGRVGRLLEETTGLGMKAPVTPWGGMARWVGLGVGAAAAWTGLQYIDYHTRNLTGTGPLSLPLQAYAKARVAQQAALEGLGIPQTADYLENLMPGLVNSPLSRGARTLGLSRFLSRRLGKAFGPWGTALGVALGTTQLTDLGQSSQNLAAVFRGDVEVPVRESRFWALGTQPFTGGRILYTRPHLIPTILSRAGTIGRYGSEAERWRQSFLPTPESWFGVRPIVDPYRLERLTYQTRPYPLTAPMFQDVPFIGPILSATVGELLKPVRPMHPEYWQGGQLFEPQGLPEQGPLGAAASLGYPQLAGLPRQPVGDPRHAIAILGKQIDIIRDFLGMPGFLAGAIKHQLTGENNFATARREIATAGQITSAERSYYDLELGGMLGMTELLRRFIPHRNRATELVNPIINQMPTWLPGTLSAFPEDARNRVDFHRGDPYAKLRMGEARLPGPGYEALHRLHSGVPGVYDAFDKWKILRDVAPFSQAFRHYDAIVRSWAQGSHIANQSDGKGWEAIFGGQRLRGLVRAVLDGDTVVVDAGGKFVTVRVVGGDAPEIAHKAFEEALPDTVAGNLAKQRLEKHILGRQVEVELTGINPGDKKYQTRMVGRVTSLGWGGRNVSAELEAAHPAYNLTAAQQAMVFNLRHDIEQRFEPYPFTERIFSNPYARIPRNMRQLTNRSLGDINRAIHERGQFSLAEKLVGHVWERLSHIVLPGPLNWPVNKLFPQRDPLEIYRMQVQGGMEFANWNTPVQGFLQPWLNQAIGFMNPNYIQPRLQRQRVVERGLDTLAYVKYRRLQHEAKDADRPDLAGFYSQQKSRTLTNAILTGNQRFVRGALPRTERGFWTHFRRETDPSRQQQILALVPEDMGVVLRQSWGQDKWEDRAAEIDMVHGLTRRAPNDWVGWHPDIPMNALKVRVAHDEAWDIHDFGFGYTDQYLAEDIFSDYTGIPEPEITFSPDLRPHAYNTAARLRLDGVSVQAGEGPGPSEIQLHLRRDPRKFFRHYERQWSPAVTGSKF